MVLTLVGAMVLTLVGLPTEAAPAAKVGAKGATRSSPNGRPSCTRHRINQLPTFTLTANFQSPMTIVNIPRMSTAIFVEPPGTARPSRRGTLAALCIVAAIAVLFIAIAALPYFRLDEAQFRTYWPRRWWLLAHIATGIVALLIGPIQLWLGLTDQHLGLHRRLGIAYVVSVVVSSAAAYYLALNTDLGWLFGAGLAGLATAWLLTTTLALMAIKRQLIEQHKEWTIRSYVVTTGFISFRIIAGVLQAAGVGTLNEQLTVASWSCWAVPLLITEAILQGRKILAVKPA